MVGTLAQRRHPVAEMGGERVKIELSERMDYGVRGGLRSRTQLKNGDQLGWGA